MEKLVAMAVAALEFLVGGRVVCLARQDQGRDTWQILLIPPRSAGRTTRAFTCASIESDGYTVTERCYDQGAWTTGGFSQSGDGVSATCWQQNGGPSIRVYCTFEDTTTEWCWDTGGSGWYKGAYSQ